MLWFFWPGIGDFIARRPWIAGIEHQRGLTGNPGGAGNRRNNCLRVAHHGLGFNFPDKSTFDDGAPRCRRFSSGPWHVARTSRAEQPVPVVTVELAGFTTQALRLEGAIDALQLQL